MKQALGLVIAVCFGVALGRWFDGSPATAAAGGGGVAEKCVAKNGDVNADGTVNLSDAVTILGHLFLGSPTELVPFCAPPQAPSGLPSTGQNQCYGDDLGWTKVPCESATCQGQDGVYATGCPSEGRFVDNGDGTVTDYCTGFQWQKDSADTNGDGQTTDQDHVQWCDALDYCENLSFAGHDDWRLPNVRELQSIVDYGSYVPSIDPAFGAYSPSYWSSTSGAAAPDFAWAVDFYYGIVNGDHKILRNYVRAVRSGP